MPGHTTAGERAAGRRHDAVTSGSDSRPARPLLRPVVIDLPSATGELRSEPEWTARDRNSQTVATTRRMRITLTALKAGAELGSEMTDDTLAVHCLEGSVDVVIDGAEASLQPGQLATIEEPRGWQVVATSDALLLLTSALGTPTTGSPDRG